MSSCLLLAAQVEGREIVTVEGLAQDGKLHPVQQAFIETGAMQCAYCTSGMIMSAVSLLNAKANPTAAEIAEFMEGNVCRCGTYRRIITAIQKAALKGVRA
jgi:aerobic-type carbon monoxide dehydrogenase small subunit (CoxS/CutS family)